MNKIDTSPEALRAVLANWAEEMLHILRAVADEKKKANKEEPKATDSFKMNWPRWYDGARVAMSSFPQSRATGTAKDNRITLTGKQAQALIDAGYGSFDGAKIRILMGYGESPVGKTTLPKNSEGMKYDAEKPRMALLDASAIEQLAQVLTFGAKKYEAHNWRKGIAKTRLLSAAFRHLFTYLRGEDNDPESGLSHVAHAMCCCMFLLGLAGRPELDDRYKDQT